MLQIMKAVVKIIVKIVWDQENLCLNSNVELQKIIDFVGILFLLCIFSSCQFHNEPEKIELITGLKSYLSFEEVKNLIQINQYQWKIVDNQQINNEKLISYQYLGIDVYDYLDIGEKGKLTLRFFNNQLYEVLFYPMDINNYIKRLKDLKGIVFNNNNNEFETKNIFICYNTTHDNIYFVKYIDNKLYEELRKLKEMND